jgi:hypothetical protein
VGEDAIDPRIKPAVDELARALEEITALAKAGRLTDEEGAGRYAAALLKYSHAVYLVDPASTSWLPPMFETGRSGRRLYWYLDDDGILQEMPQAPAVEHWKNRRRAVSDMKEAFWKLREEFGEDDARRIFREAAGLAGSEDTNCNLLEQFISRRLPLGELARAGAPNQAAESAVKKQLKRLLGSSSRKNAPPHLAALAEEGNRIRRSQPRKPGRPRKRGQT